jgi:hypothetical protein
VLECCGFEKIEHRYLEKNMNEGSEIVYDLPTKQFIFFSIISRWECSIEYLHELQNIYFALYGEELAVDTERLQAVGKEVAGD